MVWIYVMSLWFDARCISGFILTLRMNMLHPYLALPSTLNMETACFAETLERNRNSMSFEVVTEVETASVYTPSSVILSSEGSRCWSSGF